jgi:hypothetical protein
VEAVKRGWEGARDQGNKRHRNVEKSKRRKAETPKRRNAEESKRRKAKMSKSQNAERPRRRNVETPKGGRDGGNNCLGYRVAVLGRGNGCRKGAAERGG